MDDLLEKFNAPELVKNNKGAMIGAVIGYLMSDNEQAKSAVLGAIAGSLIEGRKDGN